MLNDLQLASLVSRSNLVFPYAAEHLQPTSIDLTLDNDLLIPYFNEGDYWSHEAVNYPEEQCQWIERQFSHYDVKSKYFLLASTAETINMPNDHAGFVTGKSTLARRGLQIETAGLIDPGFSGKITLEITNNAPYLFRLTAGMLIAQIYVFKIDEPAVDYSVRGHYQGQFKTTPAWTKNNI